MTGSHRSTGAVLAAALLALAATPGPTPARAAGPIVDVAAGERLAKRWCAGCHLVAADQTTASVDAPSFASLANAPAKTAEGIADFLTLPGTTHTKMPDLSLSRVEIRDIVGYIATLKK